MIDIHQIDVLAPPSYEPTGETQDIVDAIRSGAWLHVVNVWIWRVVDGHAQILFQQRDENSPFAPSLLDCSVGGHLVAGESAVDGARREMLEELGIELDESSIASLGRHFNAGLDQKGRERRRVINSLAMRWEHNLTELEMATNEVPACFWVNTEKLLLIEKAGEMKINGLTADKQPVERTVTKNDFVYNLDRLHYRIAEHIERLALKDAK